MSEHRRAERISCFLRGEISVYQGAHIGSCVVHDLSKTGARLVLDTDIVVPELLTLSIPRRHMSERVRVVRRKKNDIGVLFISPV